MKKAIFLFLLAIISSVHYAYADETRTIKLDNKGHEKETVQLSFCNIFVELQKIEEDDQYKISINLENVSEDKILYLFDVPYNEKTLKKTCNLVYDKVFLEQKEREWRSLVRDCRNHADWFPLKAKISLTSKETRKAKNADCQYTLHAPKKRKSFL